MTPDEQSSALSTEVQHLSPFEALGYSMQVATQAVEALTAATTTYNAQRRRRPQSYHAYRRRLKLIRYACSNTMYVALVNGNARTFNTAVERHKLLLKQARRTFEAGRVQRGGE